MERAIDVIHTHMPSFLKEIAGWDYFILLVVSVVLYFMTKPFGWDKYQLKTAATSFIVGVFILGFSRIAIWPYVVSYLHGFSFASVWFAGSISLFVAGLVLDSKYLLESLKIPFYVFITSSLLFHHLIN